MSTKQTTIWVHQDDKDQLEQASEHLFGTADVPHRIVVQRLIHDHDDVAVDVDDGGE